jgi:site-specific DNA recombinase
MTALAEQPLSLVEAASALRGAALARVSRKKTKGQDRERSPEQQVDAARAVTHIEGRPVKLADTAIYEERQSASRFGTKPRRQFAALLEDIKAGSYDVIILWEVDRAARELEAWAGFLNACRDRGVLVHVITHHRTYDVRIGRDWRALADDGTDAAYFSEKLSVNIRRGHKDSAERGRPSGRAPRGYTRIYDPQSGKLAFDDETGLWQQVPNDDAPMVKEIITQISKRVPINTVERDLATRGITVARSTIHAIAANPTYASLRKVGDLLVPGRWVPIVSEQVWRKAKAVLDEQRVADTVPGKVRWLLSRVAVCACGASAPMKGRAAKDNRQAAYFCPTCGTKVNAEQADAWITDLAIGRLASPDAVATLVRDTSQEASAAYTEVTRLQDKLTRHRDRLNKTNDKDEEEELFDQINRLKPQIKAALSRAAKLSTPAALADFADVLGQKDAVRERWESATVPARKAILRVLFNSIVVERSAQRGQLARHRITHTWHESP